VRGREDILLEEKAQESEKELAIIVIEICLL
jgi:hypothetical protein